MGWLLLLILGGSIVLSGVVSGLALALHKVTGVSFPRLFGDPQQKHDLGLIPALLLKTGIFSVPTIWAMFLLGFGSRAEITLLLGVAVGALLALVNVLLVKLLDRFERIGFELLGLIIGLVIGGVLGVVAMIMIGIDIPMSTEAMVFWCVCMGIGAIAGVENGKVLSGVSPRVLHHAIVCEIAMGSIMFGLGGNSFLFYAFHRFSGNSDFFDGLLFTIGPLVVGCLLGGCCVLAQFWLVLPLRYGISAILSWLIECLPSRTLQFPFFPSLFSLLFLTGVIGGITIGVQHVWETPFHQIAIFDNNEPHKISVIQPTPDGGYLLGGQTIVKIDHQGRQEWIVSALNPELQRGVRVIRTTSDSGAVAVMGNDARSLIKLNSQGYKEWEYNSPHGKIFMIETTLYHGYLLGGSMQQKRDVQYVVQLDSSGHELWKNDFEGGIRALQATSDGGFFHLGWRGAAGGAFKLNSEGQLVWKYICDYCIGSALTEGEFPGEGYFMIDWSHWKSGIYRVSQEGQKLWSRVFQNKNPYCSPPVIFGVAPDNDPLLGELLWSNYSVSKNLGLGMSSDECVIRNMQLTKLNSHGKSVWERTLHLGSMKEISTVLVTADNAYILIIGTETKKQWPRIVGCNSQGEQLWDYTLIPDKGMMSWLHGQVAQEWDSFFTIYDTISDTILNALNIRRATDRIVGYPPHQFIEKQTSMIVNSIQITPDGGVVMLIESQRRNINGEIRSESRVIKFTPPKMSLKKDGNR